jgi:hypothetical protein
MAARKTDCVERCGSIGRSVCGRPIMAYYRGDRDATHILLVSRQMDIDACARRRTAAFIRVRLVPHADTGIWIVPSMNPDGRTRGTRTNAHGVDLNRHLRLTPSLSPDGRQPPAAASHRPDRT